MTKVRVSLAEVNPLLGERFEGVRSSFLAVVPFSCGRKNVEESESRINLIHINKPEAELGIPAVLHRMKTLQSSDNVSLEQAALYRPTSCTRKSRMTQAVLFYVNSVK